MSRIDELTVCVTNFERGRFLARAIESVRAAGVRRVAVASVCPTSDGWDLLKREAASGGWLSFDYNVVEADIGCNNTWMLAAYLARTRKILVLHDDDVICPEFGAVYENEIAPVLSDEVGMATWYAHFIYDDGKTGNCEEWKFGSGTRVLPSTELALRLAAQGRCSMSPILAVFDRETVIEACKEAEAVLVHPDCLERSGMLLGTELMVYIRQATKAPKWLYVDRRLSLYGHHKDSGSIRAEREEGGIDRIIRGYDRARQLALNGKPPPAPKPKILLVTSRRSAVSPDTSKRITTARLARQFLFEQFDAIELTVPMLRLKRSLGEFPYVRDLFDLGCSHAMAEDVVVYSNDDIGFTIDAPARILAGVERGLGATACPRRLYDNPHGRPYVRSVKNCRFDGGIDVFAATPKWWAANRERMPDMIIGREFWDAILGFVIEEGAGEGMRTNGLPRPPDWLASRAYTDDVCWHEPHPSAWLALRSTPRDPGFHNRRLAKVFLEERKNKPALDALLQFPI